MHGVLACDPRVWQCPTERGLSHHEEELIGRCMGRRWCLASPPPLTCCQAVVLGKVASVHGGAVALVVAQGEEVGTRTVRGGVGKGWGWGVKGAREVRGARGQQELNVHVMNMYLHWASQTLLKNIRYTRPYGTCLCYKVCVQVQGAANCTHGVRQYIKCFVFVCLCV
jgi:hypothetical protein